MGKISLVLLQDICTMLRTLLNISQWHNTNDSHKWFSDYDKNTLVKYDIREFYPSIMKKALDKALKVAKKYIDIGG